MLFVYKKLISLQECYFPLLENDRPLQKDLSTHVVDSVATNWKALGEMLLNPDLVDKKQLEIIEENSPRDVKKCCKQMFTRWLETDTSASWKKLIAALQSPGIQLNYLAENIQKMVLKGKPMIINRYL